MELAPTVRTMDFSKNRLVLFPIAMGNFIELKQLNVEDNKLGKSKLSNYINVQYSYLSYI